MIAEENHVFLKHKALDIRRSILQMVYSAQSGHVGGSLGAADIVVALYYHLMRHDPKNPKWPQRDRFILSKGHCTSVIYAVLADCGYFPMKDLDGFRRPGSHLHGHPYHPKTPGNGLIELARENPQVLVLDSDVAKARSQHRA